ncbi:FAD binding domain-containing protein [Bradyrhizobium prioriisuperbiae]|uniref:FAD binding domain-containing protein n=1 Tax=Bradyrhizobium prioriisuperbiae TaxID=2854389 RepID=UPI0028EA79C8|nr:FAD binding domain-containing protein [Bradyrhizobium prioritasuperba]
MKPAPFDYHRPQTVPDALVLLNRFGDEAKLLAGGQSLVPMLNLRVARSPHLIDINDLSEIEAIGISPDTIEIGSLARHHRLATDPRIAEACPILSAAAATIGHYAIRQRGTLGGSLSHADPAAQLPLIATLLNASIRIGNHAGDRDVAARDFFVSSLITALDPSDMVTAVRFPTLAPSCGWGLEIFSQRHGDFAIVSAAATLQLAADGTVARVALALGGVATTPISMDAITAGFAGHLPEAAWCADVGAAVGASITPEDDSRIPATYRKELAGTLTARALMTAAQRARRTSP